MSNFRAIFEQMYVYVGVGVDGQQQEYWTFRMNEWRLAKSSDEQLTGQM